MEIINESDSHKLLCIACLCVGRSLRSFTEEKCRDFYVKALSEIHLVTVSSINLAICFECDALLRKAVAFREQVKDSYRILQTYTNEALVECLLTDVSRPPRLKVHSLESVDILPNVGDILHVEADVKREFKNELETSDEISNTVKNLADVKNEFINTGSDNERFSDEECLNVKNEFQDSASSSNDRISNKSQTDNSKWRSDYTSRIKKSKIGFNRKEAKKKLLRSDRKRRRARNGEKILEITVDPIAGPLDDSYAWYDDSACEEKSKKLEQSSIKREKKIKSIINGGTTNKTSRKQIKVIHLTHDEVMSEREQDSTTDSYTNSPFKCESCLLGFVYSKSYKAHMDAKHDKLLGEYVCSICQTVLATLESFSAHTNSHYKRYECGICKFRSADIKTTRQHLLTAHRVVIKQYKCRLCNQISNSLDSHRYHMDCHKSRVQCPDCDKTFSHRAGLMNHRLAVHENKNSFPCTLCDKVFQWKNSLKRHLEKHDTKNTKPETGAFCSPCGISFAYVCSYKRHLRNSLKHVTHEQLKYICDHCDRRFADKTKLRDHIEEKHLHRTYQCHVCLKVSKSRGHLEQHVRAVHVGRPHNKMCHHCGKGFPTKVQLESHIRTHTGERPFICEYCPTTFTQQSNLYKHNRQVHQNIKTKRYPLTKKQKPDETQTEARQAPSHHATGDFSRQGTTSQYLVAN